MSIIEYCLIALAPLAIALRCYMYSPLSKNSPARWSRLTWRQTPAN
jgi:hypothetical protein